MKKLFKMKNIYSKLVLISLLLVTMSASVSARECIDCKKVNAKSKAVHAKAAACKRAQSTAQLNINNVRALINGYGNMWYDGQNPQYHIPGDQNTCPLFCAALWIGGTDVNDQLRIAALRFGSEGDDYWPGPLKINGTASIDLPMCNAYDKHWTITKADVLEHKSHFIYGENDADHYVVPKGDLGDIPDVIRNWPAKGEGEDVSQFLAPFYDADGDLKYNPAAGDYPYYDFDNKLCPRTLKAQYGTDYSKHVLHTMETDAGIVGVRDGNRVVSGGILSDQVLKGDQTIWWVFNDMGNTHTETGGEHIGLEIRAQAFAFTTNDAINDMTFYSYEIINRSTYELQQTYFSQWVDPDLGYAFDDFVGCDVRRGLGYCYNGDEIDGPGSGNYSGIPPAVGIDFFQGPYMDPDGSDNPKIDIDKIVSSSYQDQPIKEMLAKYKMKTKSGQDSLDAKGRQVYDTVAVTDAADAFYIATREGWKSWYFHPGDSIGNCAINGVNFGNNIVDDERFGMRRFVYYNNSSTGINGEPSKASDYYYYLRGYWKNGQRMKYGGNAVNDNTTPLDCDFMFPGDSDPWGWGVNGAEIPSPWDDTYWTEVTAGNKASDRRFMQSAGPFTLKPGAVNYITVGIPFAQATSGNAWNSVEELRKIDDICQALFENCFKVLEGPDAPTLTCQELSNEIILYLDYEYPTSNNYKEKYREIDPKIPRTYQDAKGKTQFYDSTALMYIFEGYQIYQLKDASVSISDLNDVTKARLVASCDVENYYDTLSILNTYHISASGDTVPDTAINESPSQAIGTLVNYTTDASTGLVGQVMANGTNQGIRHVFRITNDAFATTNNSTLVNNKEYYFIAIAYAQNRYKQFSLTDPTYADGQKEPYLAGRKHESGNSITPIVAIPHNPAVEDGGKVAQAEFNMCPNIIRLEGYGNGGSVLRLTNRSIEELMGAKGEYGKQPGVFTAEPPQVGEDASKMNNPCMIMQPEYEENYGPINVRVIDPLRLKQGRYNIYFKAYRADGTPAEADSDMVVNEYTRWFLLAENSTDTIWSDFSISRYNEQLFIDLGITVTLKNTNDIAGNISNSQSLNNVFSGGSFGPSNYPSFYGGFVKDGAVLSSQITYANDHKRWLYGVPDDDSYPFQNWIRSGSQYAPNSFTSFLELTTPYSVSESFLDEDFFKAHTTSKNDDGRGTDNQGIDKSELFEDVASGLWAPYGLVSTLPYHPGFNFSYYLAKQSVFDSINKVIDPTGKSEQFNRNQIERQLMIPSKNLSVNYNELAKLPSVHIVFTADTTKWTRCPVIEMCDDYTQAEGKARKFSARRHASVDKLGRTCEDLGIAPNPNDPYNPAYISENGMGWFPGYAINTVSGERLNIMFGEDSRYVQYNGRDMKWNPKGSYMEGTENYIFGGRHYIYVMNATNQAFYNFLGSTDVEDRVYKHYNTPSYDAGRWAMSMLGAAERMMTTKAGASASTTVLCNGMVASTSSLNSIRDSIAMLYASVAWVNMPLVSSDYDITNPMDIPCDVAVDIDVRAPYARYLSQNKTAVTRPINRNMPTFQFIIDESSAVKTNLATAADARQSYKDSILSLINVVPNPYYSYSGYETANQLETKVRIINLPTGINENGQKEGCYIRIYTVDGTLVRTIGPTAITREASDGHSVPNTTVDWDLHNQTGIPIAGGMYLIHVSVPGIGERVIKWFGTMRPVDLNSYGF